VYWVEQRGVPGLRLLVHRYKGLGHNLVVGRERLLGLCSLVDKQFVYHIVLVLQYTLQYESLFCVGGGNIEGSHGL
jgi:hypothetical protein